MAVRTPSGVPPEQCGSSASFSGSGKQDGERREGEAEHHHNADEHRGDDPNDSGILRSEVDDHAYRMPARDSVR